MKRHPSIHNAYHMIEYPGTYRENAARVEGLGYKPARTIGFMPGWRQRFRCAWMVFTGRADALIWPGQET